MDRTTSPSAPRTLTGEPPAHPRYVVWELTLRCDLACLHCGSRAGKPRQSELTLDEARGVIDQLAQMGTVEITFIGGEAYLYKGWLDIVRYTASAGIRPTLTTGGRNFDARAAEGAKEAGLVAVSVSIDGLEDVHDTLRNVKGSFRAATAALGHARRAGIEAYANTQVNRLNLPQLAPLSEHLLASGIGAWQVQLTGPMGRAADHEGWLLQPYDMLELLPKLAEIADHLRSKGVRLESANNLGYYGPFESKIRRALWRGCQAGRYTMGIEADGSVKGCPSLPSAPYTGGNVRESSLRDLWDRSAEIRFSRDRDTSELWGYCKTCYYAEECRGGCAWTSHTLLGRRGNMPYCHHRAIELAAAGKRERLVKVEAAPGLPFDFGRFEIVEETLP